LISKITVVFGVLTFLVTCFSSAAQPKDTYGIHDDSCLVSKELLQDELKFMKYLVVQEEFQNALHVRSKLDLNCSKYPLLIDSLRYYSGWSAYREKQLIRASRELKSIRVESPFYFKSRCFAAICDAYEGEYDRAIRTLVESDMKKQSELGFSLLNFQLSGNYLLKRDFEAFDSVFSKVDTSNFQLSQEAHRLIQYRSELLSMKRKSPLLAGLMSAVIPGSGKFYAGYRGQAIAAAIPCFFLGAVATESFVKAGPRSSQFIIFASLFSVYYVGNIWGSVISVRTFKEQRYNEIDHGILVDLHIPVRRFFD